MKKIVFSIAIACTAMTALAAPVQNFGQNLAPLQAAFAQNKVHILQIGDSHTAGDYFTETLRKRLQAEIGDGGVGFAYPAKLSGQRTARHGYSGSEYTVYNSRRGSFDFPLGGVAAVSNGKTMTLTSSTYRGDTQAMQALVRGNAGNTVRLSDARGTRTLQLARDGWQTLSDTVTFPVSVTADSGVVLGGFWLTKPSGGVVSAMGINGATQSYWRKWRADVAHDLAVSRADLVILAYGTNEAFGGSTGGHKEVVQQAINQIRQGLPNAAILIVNAPNSLKNTAGSCGTAPANLQAVQSNLYELAQANGTLYWDWQAAMGGSCGMKDWMGRGLAAKDGVHFSAKGYELAANDLYSGLKMLLSGQTTGNTTRRYVATPSASTVQSAVQTGRICMKGVCRVL